MNVGYCASVTMIQKDRKLPSIAAHYCGCIASKKMDAKHYTAKGSLNVDNTISSSQDGI